MLIVRFRPELYFSVNWGSRLIVLPVFVAVLIEVFAAVFRPYSTLPKGTFRSFRIALGSLVIVAGVAAQFSPGPSPGNLINTVLLINRSLSIIFSGAFGFTVLLSTYFGIPWRPRTYGVGLGFILFMSLDLIASALSLTYWQRMPVAVNALSMGCYTVALITWLIYFYQPDTDSPAATLEQMHEVHQALGLNQRGIDTPTGIN